MSKIAAIALLLWLPTTINAQPARTVTGTVVKTTVGPRWTGIVISDGNQDYAIETSYQASAGEQLRGETSREVPISGNLSEGRQVTVWYTKMDCSKASQEGACWVTATKIVEIQTTFSQRHARNLGFVLATISLGRSTSRSFGIAGHDVEPFRIFGRKSFQR